MTHTRLISLIVAVALFMENMDSTVIATSLPAIAADIGADPLALASATLYLPTRRAARLFLNLIHIGADALIRGGSLHIEIGVGAAGETCRVAAARATCASA